jgi:hypothetical protein
MRRLGVGASEPVIRGNEERAGREWHRRPLLSFVLRFLVFAGPIAASVGIAVLLSDVLPRAINPLTAAVWIGVIAAGSLATLVVFERAARRLLPLAALLDVSLLFPDQAPKRFAVARQTGSPRDLQARLIAAHESGRLDEARTMQSVIELVLALSVHDKGTRGHSERVRVFTDLLADELKIDAHGRARLRWAALLHDVGKLEVPATILNKDGKPDEDEWEVLHRHPEEGARLVAPLLPWLEEYGSAVLQHHERYDGTGYPLGLKGDEISLAARIVSVADTYEVMTAPRPYKRPMSVSTSRKELIRVAGTQLDPTIVRAFLNISVGRLWRTIGFGAWIGQIPALSRLLSGFGRAGTLATSGAATAATAGLVVMGSLGAVGVLPNPHANTLGSAGPSVSAFAPGPGAQGAGGGGAVPTSPSGIASPGATGPDQAPGSPRAGSAVPSPVTQPSSQPTSPTPTPTPTPMSTATPAPTPTPTVGPTPAPTPDPWSCAGCTNTAKNCTSYCSGGDLKQCVTYCLGDKNSACTSHCFGDGNKKCLDYCVGKNNQVCQTNCRLQ